jgi:hypothetical protein
MNKVKNMVNLNMREKIPCVVMVFYNFEIIKRTIDFLSLDDRLSLYVIENKSMYTELEIKPYMLQNLAEGKITKYVLFDKNISNNAYEVFFDSNLIEDIGEFLIISDGDIIVPPNQFKKDWLEEEISIIEKNDDIDCCGINLSDVNLPKDNPFFNSNSNPIYNCINWVPDKFGKVHTDYVEADTGVHLLLFKRSLFDEFLNARRKMKWRFLDETLRNFVKEEKKLKWVITRRNYSIHLSWDVYNDEGHPYTKMKMTPDFYKFWKHFDYSFFTVYTKKGSSRFYPRKAIWANIKKILFRKELSKL